MRNFTIFLLLFSAVFVFIACADIKNKNDRIALIYECESNNGFWDDSQCYNPCKNNQCVHGICKTTGVRTYKCDCDEGYSVSSGGKCVDVNECSNASLNNCNKNSVCINEDGSYSCVCKDNYSGSECLPDNRTRECIGLPENAEWNEFSEIEQTWNGEDWVPPTTGSYNENSNERECRFKCKENYTWNASKCLADSRRVNCENLPDGAVWNTATSMEQTWNGSEWIPSAEGKYNPVVSETECRFICDVNYTWNGKKCLADTRSADCTDLPDHAEWNFATSITQTWDGSSWQPPSKGSFSAIASETECKFKCEVLYRWNGSICVELPEYSADNMTPCKDLETEFFWSAKSSNLMEHDESVIYCNNLSEGGFIDWRLPNINELRTLIQNCGTYEMSKFQCPIPDCSSKSDCYCLGCEEKDNGYYSKLGDTSELWSSSEVPLGVASGWWIVDFSTGELKNSGYYGEGYSKIKEYVRCVRN